MWMLERLVEWDVRIRGWLTTHHHPVADVVMVALSVIGRGGGIWIAIALVLLIQDRRRFRGVAATIVAIVMCLVVTDGIVTPLIRRARPYESAIAVRVLDIRPTTYSFPSGHAASSIASALTLSRLWPAGRYVLWALAGLVALSRIYVGVHYPADVLGGALLGTVCALLSLRLLRVPIKNQKSKIKSS